MTLAARFCFSQTRQQARDRAIACGDAGMLLGMPVRLVNIKSKIKGNGLWIEKL